MLPWGQNVETKKGGSKLLTACKSNAWVLETHFGWPKCSIHSLASLRQPLTLVFKYNYLIFGNYALGKDLRLLSIGKPSKKASRSDLRDQSLIQSNALTCSLSGSSARLEPFRWAAWGHQPHGAAQHLVQVKHTKLTSTDQYGSVRNDSNISSGASVQKENTQQISLLSTTTA